ncbi:15441_t:CDS:1, partial [Funneliformis geosporum]
LSEDISRVSTIYMTASRIKWSTFEQLIICFSIIPVFSSRKVWSHAKHVAT